VLFQLLIPGLAPVSLLQRISGFQNGNATRKRHKPTIFKSIVSEFSKVIDIEWNTFLGLYKNKRLMAEYTETLPVDGK
jgi:hypothetical protein